MTIATLKKSRSLAHAGDSRFYGACFSPCSGEWNLSGETVNEAVRSRLIRSVRESRQDCPCFTRVHILRLGKDGPCIAQDTDWSVAGVTHDVTFFTGPPRDAMWLEPGAAVVAQLAGRPLCVAIGREHRLAFIYTGAMLEKVVSAFWGHEVDPTEIAIHVMFAAPKKSADYVRAMTDLCSDWNISEIRAHQYIPYNGVYPHDGGSKGSLVLAVAR